MLWCIYIPSWVSFSLFKHILFPYPNPDDFVVASGKCSWLEGVVQEEEEGEEKEAISSIVAAAAVI